ncbi:GNAT family N-acetyltransferase [Allonocardiopsis opalescens]|uniref:Ribosomal protein S18 acetylase RimI-like enzyme n=1 Tax=Allonocardiopsis opalescens TaxID=1144618 RepID=A0A2T0Q5G3_9ACTN|nr:GNAT family N-acetyltransferase [Allonocardiopsis opalescens]PRX99010.1 ribosomal protein S18 acetylase RimI-like enzyme [Allonocardiopsis opalescens]
MAVPALRVTAAGPGELDALVAQVAGLFAEDGAQRDPFADPGWPLRHGHAYYAPLLEADDGLVLLARAPEPVGYLVGRLRGADPLRPGARVAELESMRVAPAHRGTGFGSALVRRFLAWARARGANEARVSAFAANTAAIGFYQRHGFAPARVELASPLHTGPPAGPG